MQVVVGAPGKAGQTTAQAGFLRNRDEGEDCVADAASTSTQQPRPLTGVRVLDFTQVVGGPLASLVLHDYGAEVVKIEPPAGDAARYLVGVRKKEFKPFFETFNGGKRSVVMDLKDAASHAAIISAVADVDVLIESFRPGVMEKLGLGYEQLKAINPRLVYASLSGFPEHGVSAHRAGFDVLAQAESGLMAVTGETDGAPTKVGVHVVDISSGHILAQSILAALLLRHQTGLGEQVTLSLFEVACALQAHHLTEQLSTGVAPQRTGNFPEATTPSGVYQTTDGFIVLAAYQQAHWERLVTLLGLEELLKDPEYATLADRNENRDRLLSIIKKRVAEQTTSAWMDVFDGSGLVVGRVRDYANLVDSEDFASSNLLTGVVSSGGETTDVKTIRHPAVHSGFEYPVRSRAPQLDEHQDQGIAFSPRTADVR